MALLPGWFVVWCCAKASGLGMVRQYPGASLRKQGTHTPRPRWFALGLVAPHQRKPVVMGPCFRRDDSWGMSARLLHLAPLAGRGRRVAPGEGEESYTDAVVTPPSTTMVWPVM